MTASIHTSLRTATVAPQSDVPIEQLLGLRFVSSGYGDAVYAMEAGPEHANSVGTVQGGVLCSLADCAMAAAFRTLVGEDETFTTIDLKMSFLRPMWLGPVTASASVVSSVNTLGLVECELTDVDGRVLGHSTATFMVLRGKNAEGR